MTYRRFAWPLVAVLLAAIVPVPAQADPSVPPGQPVKCLTNTPKKQVLVPCDLLNAGANFPPGQRCPPPLEQYPQDVQDWCGVGPGLAPQPPAPPTSPTSPISPTSPAKPGSPTTTTPTVATAPTSIATPTTTATATSPRATP